MRYELKCIKIKCFFDAPDLLIASIASSYVLIHMYHYGHFVISKGTKTYEIPNLLDCNKWFVDQFGQNHSVLLKKVRYTRSEELAAALDSVKQTDGFLFQDVETTAREYAFIVREQAK